MNAHIWRVVAQAASAQRCHIAQNCAQEPYKRCSVGVFDKATGDQQMRSSESEERQLHKIPWEHL